MLANIESALDIENSPVLETKKSEKGQNQSQYSKVVAQNLQQLLRSDARLQHLDLSNTGLSEEVMVALISGVKTSKSLLGLHASQNPGVTPRVVKLF